MSCQQISYKLCDKTITGFKIRGSTQNSGSINIEEKRNMYNLYTYPLPRIGMSIAQAEELAHALLELVDELKE